MLSCFKHVIETENSEMSETLQNRNKNQFFSEDLSTLSKFQRRLSPVIELNMTKQFGVFRIRDPRRIILFFSILLTVCPSLNAFVYFFLSCESTNKNTCPKIIVEIGEAAQIWKDCRKHLESKAEIRSNYKKPRETVEFSRN